MVLNSSINLVITKYKSNSQYAILTQLWPLTVSKWVLSLTWQAYHKIVKNQFLPHICRNKWLYSRDLIFCSKSSFAIFLLMFFPLFSKVFTNILKVYELPKIYNKIPKYSQELVLTIIIYQANSMSQLYLAFELYLY